MVLLLHTNYKAERYRRIHSAKVALWLYIKLIRKQKRAGGLYWSLRNRIKNTLIITSYFCKPAAEKKATHRVLRQFFEDKDQITDLKAKGRVLYRRMIRVQRVIKDKLTTRGAKLEVLLMQWDRVLNMIRDSNKKGKLDQFIEEVDLIAPEVKATALAAYLRRVRLKDMVAFYQWRNRLEGPDRQ